MPNKLERLFRPGGKPRVNIHFGLITAHGLIGHINDPITP